jgi:hypothetical protein
MATNLLKLWSYLNEWDVKTLEFALRNCTRGRASRAHPFLDRRIALAALLAANKVYGTEVHSTLRKLKSKRARDMNGAPLRARVFISCGQSKTSDETQVANAIGDRLSELGFDPYIAVAEQTLRGLKENIFDQLRKSEYFLFVDFKRELLGNSSFHRGSLFSHQELALASLLEIEVAAFQEKGVKPLDGLIQFLQANTVEFVDRNLLPDTVAKIVRQHWKPNWRNELVLEASPNPRPERSSFSTKASIARTGLPSSIQSSRHSGNSVVCPRSTPSMKRLI